MFNLLYEIFSFLFYYTKGHMSLKKQKTQSGSAYDLL